MFSCVVGDDQKGSTKKFVDVGEYVGKSEEAIKNSLFCRPIQENPTHLHNIL